MSPADAGEILRSSDGYMLGEGLPSDDAGPPTSLVALVVIMEEPNAVELLRDVAQNGTPAGRLWALLGLRARDVVVASALQSELVRSHEQVWTGAGCIVSQEPVSSLALQSDPPKQLEKARQQVHQYFRRLANMRLNASAPTVTGVASATPAPANAAR